MIIVIYIFFPDKHLPLEIQKWLYFW